MNVFSTPVFEKAAMLLAMTPEEKFLDVISFTDEDVLEHLEA